MWSAVKLRAINELRHKIYMCSPAILSQLRARDWPWDKNS